MEKNNFDQMKCESCGSWHFAIYLDDMYKPTGEIKCCKCNRFFNMNEGVLIDTPDKLKKIEKKNKQMRVEK